MADRREARQGTGNLYIWCLRNVAQCSVLGNLVVMTTKRRSQAGYEAKEGTPALTEQASR